MAELVQQRKTISNPVVSATLAVALLGGLAGGAVAIADPRGHPGPRRRRGRPGRRSPKWLTYGQEWEKRYRQMYPIFE